MSQPEGLVRRRARTAGESQRLDPLPTGERLAGLAAVAGLDAMAAKAGVTPARARQCLADEAALQKLVTMRGVAVDSHGLEGTPTFLINGRKAEGRSEEHTSELQSLMRISYAVFCLKKKKTNNKTNNRTKR